MNKFILCIPVALFIYIFLLNGSDRFVETIDELGSLNAEISKLESKLRKSSTGLDLYPTIDYWTRLERLADSSSVKLTWIDEKLHKGNYHSYSGIIEGKSDYVVSLLGKYHEEIPLEIHKFSIADGIAKFYISILGVDR
jgi:hypothetical protein